MRVCVCQGALRLSQPRGVCASDGDRRKDKQTDRQAEKAGRDTARRDQEDHRTTGPGEYQRRSSNNKLCTDLH